MLTISVELKTVIIFVDWRIFQNKVDERKKKNLYWATLLKAYQNGRICHWISCFSGLLLYSIGKNNRENFSQSLSKIWLWPCIVLKQFQCFSTLVFVILFEQKKIYFWPQYYQMWKTNVNIVMFILVEAQIHYLTHELWEIGCL